MITQHLTGIYCFEAAFKIAQLGKQMPGKYFSNVFYLKLLTFLNTKNKMISHYLQKMDHMFFGSFISGAFILGLLLSHDKDFY